MRLLIGRGDGVNVLPCNLTGQTLVRKVMLSSPLVLPDIPIVLPCPSCLMC